MIYYCILQVAFTGAHTPVDEAVIDSVTQQDVNKVGES